MSNLQNYTYSVLISKLNDDNCRFIADKSSIFISSLFEDDCIASYDEATLISICDKDYILTLTECNDICTVSIKRLIHYVSEQELLSRF